MLAIVPWHVAQATFTGSRFNHPDMDAFLAMIAIAQDRMNPYAWTPFTWAQFVDVCGSDPIPTKTQYKILEAMVDGGTVTLDDGRSVTIPRGLFQKIEDLYYITPHMLDVMEPFAEEVTY